MGDFNQYAQQLFDPRLGFTDPKTKENIHINIIFRLRNNVEILQSQEQYQLFLAKVYPAFVKILRETEPQFVENDIQKIRNGILEVINRMPNNDLLKQHVSELLAEMMKLLEIENEVNAAVCLRIIIDLHKSYRTLPGMDQQVQPFLEIVRKIYDNMERVVNQLFNSPKNPNESKQLIKSMESFKVLTDCPLIVVLLFQLYRQPVSKIPAEFIASIAKTLSLQPKAQEQAQEQARLASKKFLGMHPSLADRAQHYSDFIAAQVKTASFIAFLLRGNTQLLINEKNSLPTYIIQLLQNCPAEAAATRKELLVATRHILSTDFKGPFVREIDNLLDEQLLSGTGYTANQTLRPLAYSMLADLILFVKSELNAEQMMRIVKIYVNNLHDPTITIAIQTLSAKLLVNIVDTILSKPEGGSIMIVLLNALVNKFSTIQHNLPPSSDSTSMATAATTITTTTTSGTSSTTISTPVPVSDSSISTPTPSTTGAATSDAAAATTDPKQEESRYDINSMLPIRCFDVPSDPQKEMRLLFRTLVTGMKTMVYAMSQHAIAASNAAVAAATAAGATTPTGALMPPPPIAQHYYPFSAQDLSIFLRLLKDGLYAFDIFIPPPELDEKAANMASSPQPVTTKEEKELLDIYASIFNFLEPALFQEIFSSQMQFLFDRIVQNQKLLTIPQQFLSSAGVSKKFAEILLKFLIDRLELLGGDDKMVSVVILRLFKLLFGAVALFADNPAASSETVLQPHLGTIIKSSLKLSSNVKDPINYFLLLRALFRSIGGGKFELLYKEFLPLLPILLENLNRLLAEYSQTKSEPSSPSRPQMRELFVELCLTVPVRLSALLPHLHYLMRPLVMALQAGPDLVSQGLRTLELCIDNLTPSFLDPIMNPVMNELIEALWKHLKPLPYNANHGHTTLKILGKLGGRNRRISKEPRLLSYEKNFEPGLVAQIIFEDGRNVDLNLDAAVYHAKQVLTESSKTEDKLEAFRFLKNSLILLIDAEAGDDTYANYVRPKPQNAPNPIINNPQMEKNLLVKGLANRKLKLSQEKILENILLCMFIGAAQEEEEIKKEATEILDGLAKHFAILKVSEAMSSRNPLLRATSLDTDTFAAAIVNALSSEDLAWRPKVETVLRSFFDASETLLTAKGYGWARLPIYDTLANRFCSCCYERYSHSKSGGVEGISILISKLNLGDMWLLKHEIKFVRALLFVIKDLSTEVNASPIEAAKDALFALLKSCNNKPSEPSEPENDRKRLFDDLVKLLVAELSNANPTVRETVQSCFQLLAELNGNEISELLEPCREKLLSPIFNKPLRALPINIQIGHIDAITYCLTLRPPLLSFDATNNNSTNLMRLIMDALNIADADEQALISKNPAYKNVPSLTGLRVACVKLLSAAMPAPEFQQQQSQQAQQRNRIIQVFFKFLQVSTPEVVEVAKKGLSQVIASTGLPKELLQSSIRPVLLTLADHRRLDVQCLQSLSRLLELLTNCFNVALGEKLLEHLKKWAEPTKIQGSQRPPEAKDFQVTAAILDVFHLLPSSAVKFLDSLVTTTLHLEKTLKQYASSPFRAPLANFLNVYPVEAVEYFFKQFSNFDLARLFHGIVSNDLAPNLNKEIMKQTDKIATSISPYQDSNEDSIFNFIHLVHILAQKNPNWLAEPTTKGVVDSLVQVWKNKEGIYRTAAVVREGQPLLNLIQESKLIIECLVLYIRAVRNEIDLLYEMILLLTLPTNVDTTFLNKFYQEEVALKWPLETRMEIISKFPVYLKDPKITFEKKVKCLQLIILPILVIAHQRKEQLDEPVVANLLKETLIPKQALDPNKCYWSDALHLEILQLVTLLIQYAPKVASKFRKEIVTFTQSHIKVEEDPCIKYAAYVCEAKFIETFPEHGFIKLAMQDFVALLRGHQLEARTPVRQALDILTPLLPTLEVDKKHEWIGWMKKIVLEDSHSTPQLVLIWQLIARHSSLFYEFRHHFMSQIISSLNRIGVGNTTPENRNLTLELTELILKWEKRRLGLEDKNLDGTKVKRSPDGSSEVPAKRVKSEVGYNSPTGTPMASYTPSTPSSLTTPSESALGIPSENKIWLETIITFLIRLGFAPTDLNERKVVAPRCIELLDEYLKFETSLDVNIRLTHIERVLTSLIPDEQKETFFAPHGVICTAIDFLRVIVTRRGLTFLNTALRSIMHYIHNLIAVENINVLRSVIALLGAVYRIVPHPSQDNDMDVVALEISTEEKEFNVMVEEFHKKVDKELMEGFTQPNRNYMGILLYKECIQDNITSFNKYLPKFIDMFELIVRNYHDKLAQKRVYTLQSYSRMGPQGGRVGPLAIQVSTVAAQINTLTQQITMCLDILKNNNEHLTDELRTRYLQALQDLIEPTTESDLLSHIISMMSNWITNGAEPAPTLKEKTAIMTKMLCIEQKNDEKVWIQFLELVLTIYLNKAFYRSELTSKLEPAFLAGLRCPSAKLRQSFLEIFHQNLGRRVFDRIYYLLKTQNWESEASNFWIAAMVEGMLAIAIQTETLVPSENSLQTPSILHLITHGDNHLPIDPNAAVDEKVLEKLNTLISTQQEFLKKFADVKVESLLAPLRNLFHGNTKLSFQVWLDMFPQLWKQLLRDEQLELVQIFQNLLVQSYHLKQRQLRPNVIQCFMESIAACEPAIILPPPLVKFLGKKFNCWHVAINMLQNYVTICKSNIKQSNAISSFQGELKFLDDYDQLQEIINSSMDSLAEIYTLLSEDDMFFGLWRGRAAFPQTTVALSFEQAGMWQKAQEMYLIVQEKARMGALPFLEAEYCLWEAHWNECTKKLQKWDILVELAQQQQDRELLLECCWKLSDFKQEAVQLQQYQQLYPDNRDPKIKIYEIYLALQDLEGQKKEPPMAGGSAPTVPFAPIKNRDFTKLIEEGFQCCLQAWASLPDLVSHSHLPLMQMFQQYVELIESQQILVIIANAASRQQQMIVQDIKGILTTWRERLPNKWDDINVWNDLLSWRQHIFAAINSAFQQQQLLVMNDQTRASNSAITFLGFHETAWTINRFAQVARKHDLIEVCLNSLQKIYTLPNIEIQDAFLKLREQAKCYLRPPSELNNGLEIINNTNLSFFSDSQKAEFFALKGIFLHRIAQKADESTNKQIFNDKAGQVFSTAIQLYWESAKAWAAWGQYCDHLFREKRDIQFGIDAVNCYLHAAALGKDSVDRSKRLIARVLWLVSMDDQGTLAKAFEMSADVVPVWYWITFIPQLLTSLTRPESKQVTTTTINPLPPQNK